MEFKMTEASIDDALKVLKENTEPFDLMAELENRMREFTESNLLSESAKERQRAIRLPSMAATEISVGQRPSSEERADFEKWMANIGGEGSVNDKLKVISHYFENPGEQIQGSSIPEVLSYLMFLNYFTWMLKEFNAAVAGFLWEPFLASLFSGKSRQVPTSEHDIADIRIDTPMGKNEPISLKILNKKGDVKGSFTDLVNHFAKGGQNMRYVIVVKEQSGKKKDVSAVTFYEFDINNDTFFDWIGYLKHTETIEKSVPRKFKLFLEKGKKGPFKNTGGLFQVKHAKVTGKRTATEEWYSLAKKAKGGIFVIKPEVAELVNLQGPDGPVREGILDPGVNYTVDLAQYVAGGVGGAALQKGFEEVPGLGGKSTDKIWGSPDERSRWLGIAQGMPRNEFWAKVKAEAPGYQKNEQFYITPSHYMGKGEKIGFLKITDQKVKEVFQLGADQIGPQMTEMFNAMAELTDNIGRFFLTDCGGKKCSKRDAQNQDMAGLTAIQNSQTLKVAVEKSVAQMKGTGATQMDYSVSPPKLTHAEE